MTSLLFDTTNGKIYLCQTNSDRILEVGKIQDITWFNPTKPMLGVLVKLIFVKKPQKNKIGFFPYTITEKVYQLPDFEKELLF